MDFADEWHICVTDCYYAGATIDAIHIASAMGILSEAVIRYDLSTVANHQDPVQIDKCRGRLNWCYRDEQREPNGQQEARIDVAASGPPLAAMECRRRGGRNDRLMRFWRCVKEELPYRKPVRNNAPMHVRARGVRGNPPRNWTQLSMQIAVKADDLPRQTGKEARGYRCCAIRLG